MSGGEYKVQEIKSKLTLDVHFFKSLDGSSIIQVKPFITRTNGY